MAVFSSKMMEASPDTVSPEARLFLGRTEKVTKPSPWCRLSFTSKKPNWALAGSKPVAGSTLWKYQKIWFFAMSIPAVTSTHTPSESDTSSRLV